MDEKQFIMRWLQPWQDCITWIGEILDYLILVVKQIIWEDRYTTTKLLVIASYCNNNYLSNCDPFLNSVKFPVSVKLMLLALCLCDISFPRPNVCFKTYWKLFGQAIVYYCWIVSGLPSGIQGKIILDEKDSRRKYKWSHLFSFFRQ